LYTEDFYKLCRARLATGGVVAQWLPLHAQSLASAKATARTFLEAFPYVELWLPSIRDAVLIGSATPLTLDTSRLRAAYDSPATRASFTDAYFETPEALLGTYLLDRDGVALWTQGSDLITDDQPRIEFFRRYGPTMSDRDITTLLSLAPGSLDDVLGAGADPGLRQAVEAERRAHLLYLRAEIDKDGRGAREAALASTGTHFGLYRLGCDGPQLDALHADPRGEAAWQKQVETCRGLTR
jgi:spermidine synthase